MYTNENKIILDTLRIIKYEEDLDDKLNCVIYNCDIISRKSNHSFELINKIEKLQSEFKLLTYDKFKSIEEQYTEICSMYNSIRMLKPRKEKSLLSYAPDMFGGFKKGIVIKEPYGIEGIIEQGNIFGYLDEKIEDYIMLNGNKPVLTTNKKVMYSFFELKFYNDVEFELPYIKLVIDDTKEDGYMYLDY